MFEENLQLKNGAFALSVGQPMRPKNRTFSDVFAPAKPKPIEIAPITPNIAQVPVEVSAPVQAMPDTAVLPDFLLHHQPVKASSLSELSAWSVRKPFLFMALATCGLIVAAAGFQILLNRQPAQAVAVQPPAKSSSYLAPAVLGASAASDQSAASDLPKSLEIAQLNINAKIISADFTENGNLTKSIDIHDVAWNKASSKPGKQGTMVIASNTYSCVAPGVFSNLKDIALGADILVTNGAGTVTDYKVIRVQAYDQAKVNLETLSDPPVHYRPGLNIVTCADNNETGKRLVVNAVLYN